MNELCGKGAGELVDMSSQQTVDGLMQGLLGMKRGEVKDVPVKLESGAKAAFHVTVKECHAGSPLGIPTGAGAQQVTGRDSIDTVEAAIGPIIVGVVIGVILEQGLDLRRTKADALPRVE